jgi:UV DNA damage repair endonuclease
MVSALRYKPKIFSVGQLTKTVLRTIIKLFQFNCLWKIEFTTFRISSFKAGVVNHAVHIQVIEHVQNFPMLWYGLTLHLRPIANI